MNGMNPSWTRQNADTHPSQPKEKKKTWHY
jgi:hypothetical protein